MCWPAFEAAQTWCKSIPCAKELPSWVCQGYGPHPGICRQGFAVISPPATHGSLQVAASFALLSVVDFSSESKMSCAKQTHKASLLNMKHDLRYLFTPHSWHSVWLHISYTDNCTFPLPVCRTRAWQCSSTHECSSSQSHLLQALTERHHHAVITMN